MIDYKYSLSWLCRVMPLTGLLLMAGCAPMPAQTLLSTHPIQASKPADVQLVHDLATQDRDPVPADLADQDAVVDGVPMADDASNATTMAPVQLDANALKHFGNVWESLRAGFNLTISDNSRIIIQRNWFASHQSYLDRMTDRASRYMGYTVAEAARRHLPTELALLPVIESAYDPFAVSRAQAVGLWQFVPGTGRIFGLRESGSYDGRRDIIDSTRAAYDFLSSLYDKYHDWNLVLAAYNAGPGAVDKAIARNMAAGISTDYWSLNLPEETLAYVPRFLAMVQIVSNPEHYGVQLKPIVNDAYFRIVSIPGSVDLNNVAKLTGISYSELHALNPGFHYSVTDSQGPLRLLVPSDTDAHLDATLSNLPPPQRLPTQQYVVRHSDNLFRIARRFGMSVTQLMELNHLNTHHLHHGQLLEIGMNQPTAETPEATHTPYMHTHTWSIRIKHRATLKQIAAQYHVGVHELAVLNGLGQHSVCHAGQHLNMAKSDRSVHEISHPDRRKIRYAVHQGDTLFSISKRYQVSIHDIRSWNHASQRTLHPGQDLVLYITKNNRDAS